MFFSDCAQGAFAFMLRLRIQKVFRSLIKLLIASIFNPPSIANIKLFSTNCSKILIRNKFVINMIQLMNKSRTWQRNEKKTDFILKKI